MKAVRMHGHGGVEQLFFEDANDPLIDAAEQATVKLRASAINHIDLESPRPDWRTDNNVAYSWR